MKDQETLSDSKRKADHLKKYRDSYRNEHNRSIRRLDIFEALPAHVCRDVPLRQAIINEFEKTKLSPDEVVAKLKSEGRI